MSTVEYVLILVLVAAVSIVAWRFYGDSVRRALGAADQKLGLLIDADGLASAGSGATPGPGEGKPGTGAGKPGSGGKPSGGGANSRSTSMTRGRRQRRLSRLRTKPATP